MKGWVFLGDAHLNPYRKDGTWDKFMALADDPPEGLCFVGDFFDFWFGFGDPRYLEDLYRDLAPAFGRLRERGTRVLYLEGNHDFSMPRTLFGLPIEPRRWEADLELSGKRIYIAHGDRCSGFPHNLPSILLKNPLSRWAIRGLGPKIVVPIAFLWAEHSRGRPSDGGIQERLRSFARGKIEEGFDVVIMAHTHRAEAAEFSLGGRRGRYFNVGSFREGTFLLFRGGEFSFQQI